MTTARILVPISVTAAMLSAGTSIAEPDTTRGEAVWASGTAYTVGQRVTHSGSVWEAVASSTGVTPGTDGKKWLRFGPTNRMAAFDDYTTTRSVGTTSITFVMRPGFINGLRLDGLEGIQLVATLKDAPGGTVIWTESVELFEQALGLYELLFSPLIALKAVSFDNLPLSPDPELTITITAASGAAVGVGSIMLGDWRPLIGDGSFGGAQYGARMVRKSYTYWDEKDDGTYSLIRRPSKRDVSCSVAIDANQAMYADALLEEITDRLVAFEASDLPRYGYLNTTGFVSGDITADNFSVTTLDLNIKGSI
ncbi:MAG TPA: hypothetical protein PLE21_00290 [Giesbergeria sp.]|nr:hypothetical protein [Giesbergeria sp.]